MRTGLTKPQAEAITTAPTEEAKVRAAAEVMVERPLDLIKHILMRHEQAVIEVMREQQERIATLESENAALLAANRDCIVHFETLRSDYAKSQAVLRTALDALYAVAGKGAKCNAAIKAIKEIL